MTFLHVSQHVEHLAHHPTAEERPVVDVAALNQLLLHHVILVGSNLHELYGNGLAVLDFDNLLVSEGEVLAHVVAQGTESVHTLLCLGLLVSPSLVGCCLYVLNYYVQVLTSDCCNLFHNSKIKLVITKFTKSRG